MVFIIVSDKKGEMENRFGTRRKYRKIREMRNAEGRGNRGRGKSYHLASIAWKMRLGTHRPELPQPFAYL